MDFHPANVASGPTIRVIVVKSSHLLPCCRKTSHCTWSLDTALKGVDVLLASIENYAPISDLLRFQAVASSLREAKKEFLAPYV